MVGLWYNLQQYLQQNVQQNYETRTASIGYYYYRHPSVMRVDPWRLALSSQRC